MAVAHFLERLVLLAQGNTLHYKHNLNEKGKPDYVKRTLLTDIVVLICDVKKNWFGLPKSNGTHSSSNIVQRKPHLRKIKT